MCKKNLPWVSRPRSISQCTYSYEVCWWCWWMLWSWCYWWFNSWCAYGELPTDPLEAFIVNSCVMENLESLEYVHLLEFSSQHISSKSQFELLDAPSPMASHIMSSIEEPPSLELKPLPIHLWCFLRWIIYPPRYYLFFIWWWARKQAALEC